MDLVTFIALANRYAALGHDVQCAMATVLDNTEDASEVDQSDLKQIVEFLREASGAGIDDVRELSAILGAQVEG